MEKMNKKLRSRQGTSIFFGILFFLIASILSIVMLNGAVTAVKSVQSDRKAEQNFLTCSSAAKTLRDAITDMKITRTQRTKYQGSKATSEEPVWTVASRSETSDSAAVTLGNAYLVSWISELADASATAIPGKKTLKIQGPDQEAMQDVEASVTIKKDAEHTVTVGTGTAKKTYNSYDLFIVLTAGEGLDSCQMTIELSGGCSGNDSQIEEGTNTVYTTSVDFTWNAERILYGSDTEAQEAGS